MLRSKREEPALKTVIHRMLSSQLRLSDPRFHPTLLCTPFPLVHFQLVYHCHCLPQIGATVKPYGARLNSNELSSGMVGNSTTLGQSITIDYYLINHPQCPLPTAFPSNFTRGGKFPSWRPSNQRSSVSGWWSHSTRSQWWNLKLVDFIIMERRAKLTLVTKMSRWIAFLLVTFR